MSLSQRAVVLAPQGRDANVACAMLLEAGMPAEIARDLNDLIGKLSEGAGFAVMTEEALKDADLRPLAHWLEGQPQWSDFPFVLLTKRGGGLERNPAATRHLEVLGNVTFLERPFHPTTLVSLGRSALRARRKQYEARAKLEELDRLAADLERKVEERTAEHAEAVAQLHEVQKLETLGQLTGGVAHDFNNLLTPITGALDVLQRKYGKSDPRSGRLLANAQQAADRAKTLLQRLLGFARRQALRTEPVEIGGLLTGMHDLISSSVGPTIVVHLRCDPGIHPASIDPNQLELAILNLCVNARDAMSEGGPLTILVEEVAMGPGSRPQLKPGLYIRVSVIDAGCGMDSETMAHAFEPFFSTKETGRGTGLGLSMVHGLAAQLGGAVHLTSAPGEGTRVDMYLPVASEAAPVSRRSTGAPTARAGRRLDILLVDDEDLVRAATGEMLRDLGHRVEESPGPLDALARFESGSTFDVVITDYMMPGMDGYALAQRIRRVWPGVPVLLITGYTGPTEKVLELPILSKPFGQAEIAAELNNIFEESDKVVRFPRRTRPKS